MAKAGYSYVVLDEGWQALTRDASGRQQADPVKFPSGILNLASYIHSAGLKIGIYRLGVSFSITAVLTNLPM
jgi:alpha-galactosidase